MNYAFFGFLLFGGLLISCQSPSTSLNLKTDSSSINVDSTLNQKVKYQRILRPGKWEIFPLGRINGDSITDTAFVYTPAYYELADSLYPLFDACAGDSCYNIIRFSSGFPEIKIQNSLWSRVERIDDLNQDGINEIMVEKNWWIGFHITLLVYSFLEGKWTVLAKDHLYQQESYKDRVIKKNKSSFWFKDEFNKDGDYSTRKVKVVFGVPFDGTNN